MIDSNYKTAISQNFNFECSIDERPYKKKNYDSTDWYGRAEQDCNLLPLSYNVRHGTQRNQKCSGVHLYNNESDYSYLLNLKQFDSFLLWTITQTEICACKPEEKLSRLLGSFCYCCRIFLRDGPLENLWGVADEVQRNTRAREN